MTLKLGFLASGNATSARAIVAAIRQGKLDVEARLLVSNNAKAPALGFATEAGLPNLCVPTRMDPDQADQDLLAVLMNHGVELVVLSGYLRKLGSRVTGAFAGRILNIHPALLPDFGGPGMYGRRVHEAVIAAGVPFSGMTIHLVDEEYDRGPMLAERRIPVERGDTAEILEARITALEPAFYVDTLQAIASGSMVLPGIGR